MTYTIEDYASRPEALSPDDLRAAAITWIRPERFRRLLDLGSGDGGWVRALQNRSPGIDIQCVDLVDAGASRYAPLTKLDLAHGRVPFGDDCMDAVTAIEVIEHVANPRHLVAEAARVLRRGGCLYLTTPSCDSVRARLSMGLRGYWPHCCDADYVGSGHILGLTELDLRRLAAEVGLEAHFRYLTVGRMPGLAVSWPWRGRAWTDTTFCEMRKP